MSSGFRIVLLVAIAAGFGIIVPLQQWMDSNNASASVEEESLYLSNGDQVKRLALGYDGLLADVYWMRAVQHFGEKTIANSRKTTSAKTPPVLLYPMLDVTTTLDPQYIEPYRFGGFFLADFVDRDLAVELLQKGIEANPENVSLRLDLGFLYWSTGDCEAASAAYAGASRTPGAAPWIAQMSAIVLAECGKRDFAIRMLRTMYESTDDRRVREEIDLKMRGYEALAEIELLSRARDSYELRYGTLPHSLALLIRAVRPPDDGNGIRVRIDAAGQPVDPNGEPYQYNPMSGEITTNPESIVLPKNVMRRYAEAGRSK